MASAQSSMKYFSSEQKIAQELVDHIIFGARHSCNPYHHYGNCNDRQWRKFQQIFKTLVKINLPIHVLPVLIFKIKQLLKNPVGTLSKLVINILRSVMFLGSFVMTIHFVQCYGSRLFPQLSINAIHWISAAISGLGILFEQPHKRVEITYYTLPKAFESFWNTLERRNYVMNIPYQEVRQFEVFFVKFFYKFIVELFLFKMLIVVLPIFICSGHNSNQYYQII